VRLICLTVLGCLAFNNLLTSQPVGRQATNSAKIVSRKARSLPSSRDREAALTAQKGLANLRSLVTRENFRQFGLESFDEASKLQLGNPVPLYYVRADQLKEYQPGTDAGKLMINANRRLYPVVVDGIGRLLITIEKAGDAWRMVSFGQQDIAPTLTKIKHDKLRRTASGPGASDTNYFAVQIPSMHLNFLAYAAAPGPGGSEDSKRQVTLIPLVSGTQLSANIGFQNSQFLIVHPSFNAEKQGSRAANEVFKTLAPNADAAMKTTAPQ
jgi:hypothetical protein